MTQPFIPPWLAHAIGELGELEVPGAGNNPRIVGYHAATSGGAAADIVAHCSSFVNWCMQQSGIVGTRSKSARSWLTWGVLLKEPRLGCITVLWRGSPTAATGHVAMYLGHNKLGVHLLGANQHNEVNVQRYAHKRVLAYVWPKEPELVA